MNLRDPFNLIKYVFKGYTKGLSLSIFFSLLFTLFDTISVISLIPVIELLNKTPQEEATKYSKAINTFLTFFEIDKNLTIYLLIFISCISLKAIFNYLVKVSVLSTRVSLEGELGFSLYEGTLKSRGEWVNQLKNGVFTNLISTETQKVGESLYYGIFLFAIILKFLFYSTILASFSLELITFIAFGGIFTLLPSIILNKRVTDSSEKRIDLNARVLSFLVDTTNNLVTLKSYVAEKFFSEKFKSLYFEYKKSHSHMIIIREISTIAYEPIAVLLISLIIYFSLNFFKLTFAEVLIVLFTLRNILPLVGQFITCKQVLISSVPSFVRIMNAINDNDKNVENYFGANFPEEFNNISFSNVVFSYNNTKLLSSLNFNINSGQAVALVGASGAGKSTIVKLLIGLYKINSGSIQVDGIPLSNFSVSSLRSNIGFVSQDTTLIHGTILENITLGSKLVDVDRVVQCLKDAHLHEYIMKLPRGLDTLVGDGCIQLSGGQLQRLSLSRALYKAPNILILDEPTSALDSESEKYIQQTLEVLHGKITLIIIAHRLSTIKSCDSIFYIEKGVVAESGNYDSLLRQNGKFTNLVKLQEARR